MNPCAFLRAANASGMFPEEQSRCPVAEITEPDPYVSEVIGIYRDCDMGAVKGWPDRFTAGVVGAVRFLRSESEACQAELMLGD